jgi:hypothetical protein
VAHAELWKREPEEHDYPAAGEYLSLLADAATVARTVAALRGGPIVTRKAKDLMRASGLRLLPSDNHHVARDLARIRAGERLSPVLLVRGDLRFGMALIVADGYHRICASYHLDEDAEIPCALAALVG